MCDNANCQRIILECGELKRFVARWFDVLSRRFDDQDRKFNEQDKKLNILLASVAQVTDPFTNDVPASCVQDNPVENSPVAFIVDPNDENDDVKPISEIPVPFSAARKTESESHPRRRDIVNSVIDRPSQQPLNIYSVLASTVKTSDHSTSVNIPVNWPSSLNSTSSFSDYCNLNGSHDDGVAQNCLTFKNGLSFNPYVPIATLTLPATVPGSETASLESNPGIVKQTAKKRTINMHSKILSRVHGRFASRRSSDDSIISSGISPAQTSRRSSQTNLQKVMNVGRSRQPARVRLRLGRSTTLKSDDKKSCMTCVSSTPVRRKKVRRINDESLTVVHSEEDGSLSLPDRRTPPILSKSKSASNNFSCPICSRRFQYMSSVVRHQATKHSSENPAVKGFDCPKCGKVFTWKDTVSKHLRNNNCPMNLTA